MAAAAATATEEQPPSAVVLPTNGGGSYNNKRKLAPPASLPDDILEAIFLHLPLKELRRLSVLSKRFRHTWKLCRNLSFDRSFAATLSKEQFKAAVSYFLNHHANTPADRFSLRYDAAGETNLVCQWIHRAVSFGIREFELDFTPSPKKFMLSSNLVDVESIKVMKLVNCELHLPFRSAIGLRHLKELTLESMRARPISVQAIFRNCYGLTSLNIINCSHIYILKIYAQKLKSFRTLVIKDCTEVHSVVLNAPQIQKFHYRGKICEVYFQSNLPCLNDVGIEFTHPRGFQLIPRRKEMITSLAFVRSLTITSAFLEGLKEKVFCMWKLEELHLKVAPESYINPSDAVMFLSKCPRIERILIDVGQNAMNGDSYHWRSVGRKYLNECITVFPFLRYAKIRGFSLKEQPVVMGRFFLKHAVCLRSLVVVKAKHHRHHHNNSNSHGVPEDVMIKECLGWGIPSNAQIEIYEYQQGDKSSSAIIPQNSKGLSIRS